MTVDLARVRALVSASILSDVLDQLGWREQAMRPFVRPLDEGRTLVGRARTGLYRPVWHVAQGANPYDVEIALVDDLKPDEVAVLACDGPSERIGPWGELLSTAARARGAVGCVTDGLVRDVRQIRAMGFAVFAGGIAPLDSKGRGRMEERDVPVRCAGVMVRSGDLVVGDADGAVVVPREVEEEAVAAALAKAQGEDRSREELAAGAKLADVFARHGIL
jgi:regulator of RNase E activity RraA